MAKEEDPKLSEDEPLEEADATECAPSASLSEFKAGERDAKVEACEASFREEIFETFNPRKDVLVPSPVDGMPVPRDETQDYATAHPFTYETQTCIEDDRIYVELFRDELDERGWKLVRGWRPVFISRGVWIPKEDVRHSMLGRVAVPRDRYDDEGRLVERSQYEPDKVERMFGVLVARGRRALVPVRPVREACIYYKRQVMANDDARNPDEFGHFLVFRNCTKRRSVGGAFMTLRDEAMYACDYRQPPDPGSVEKHLDSKDREALASERHKELVRPFNLKG